MIRVPINTVKYIHLHWALAFLEEEQLSSPPGNKWPEVKYRVR